ncbi:MULTISPECIES: globin-coupled sensor protein [Sporosarcina]|uniref:globin-coupled sensor protein n=1 Tax=Sporosarcina TaxID=1569 RepID=UPI001890BFF4|nr:MULTISPECIES: globin-coupled sensor protein [Sporosarcina]GKV66095.1 heme-based aerotactic transducer HemAT [Sporosarcina sp. NCCP-2331]GLB56147.1 heme-based aerotactic transducer HemAT [Sporosarcina sp. NCCP-2378]
MFSFRKNDMNKTEVSNDLLGVEKMKGSIQLERHPSVKKQLAMIHLTEEDLGYLMQIQHSIKSTIPVMVDAFYKAMEAEPDLGRIINEHSSMERLKVSLTKHLQSMFDGVIDDRYLEQRKTIAKIHVYIGLESKWYLAAFETIQDEFLQFIEQSSIEKDLQFRMLRAFLRVLNLEQQLVLEAYEDVSEGKRLEVEQAKVAVREKIGSTAQELAAISEQTSASTEELSAKSSVLEQMTADNLSFITETERNSFHNKELVVRQAKQFAEMVNHMKELMKRMDELYSSSDQIREVVTLITSIADQTNLLSLNAAIEAARAGQHGKGFAVVATEVRNLSVETKKAISHVSSMTEKTNATIRDMANFVKLMEQLIQASANGNEQVTSSYNEIVQAVSGMKEQSEHSKTSIENTVKILQEINQAVESIAHSSDGLMQLSEDL